MALIYGKQITENTITDREINNAGNFNMNGLTLASTLQVNGNAVLGNDSSADTITINADTTLSAGSTFTLAADPTLALHAATKQYVDAVAQGLSVKDAVRVATTAALPDATYDNGTSGVGATLTADINGALGNVDGVAVIIGDRVLVKNQASGLENGIYEVTQVGDGTNPWILTRTTDFDDAPDGEITDGSFVFVGEGTTNADSGWVQTASEPITVGTTSLSFAQFSGAGQVTAGSGLTKTGNTLDVNVDDSTIEITSDILGLKAGGITNSHISSIAGIDTTKLADGSVTNTEFQYIGGLTSDAQTQIDSKVGSSDLASTANGAGASLVGIEDTGTYFTSTTVEGALQELAADVASQASSGTVTDIQDVIGSTTGLAGIVFTEDNFIVDGTSLESNIDKLDIELFDIYEAVGLTAAEGVTDLTYSVSPRIVANATSLETAIGALDAAAAKSTDLASTSNSQGASLIGVEDAGAYFTSTTVEGTLQEIGAQLSGAGTIDTRLDNLEAVVGSTTGLAGIDFTSNNVVTDGSSLEAAISAIDAFFGANVSTADFDKLADITATASQINTAVNAAHNNVQDQLTITTNGQTAFTLAFTPMNVSAVKLYVNGVQQHYSTDFTVTGTSLTWSSGDFSLETTDSLTAVYDTAA